MGVITINAIKDGVGKALSGFGFEVGDEQSEQGFEEPCFFVEVVSVFQKRIGFRRIERRQQMCVHFFPKEPETEELRNTNNEINEITEKLYRLLEYIDADGTPCRGTGMNHRTDNGILHFMVSYNCQLIELPEPDPVMDTLEHNEEVKMSGLY